MFNKRDKKEYYSFRKFKGIGLASALVGLAFLGSQHVSAEEITTGVTRDNGVVTITAGDATIKLKDSHVTKNNGAQTEIEVEKKEKDVLAKEEANFSNPETVTETVSGDVSIDYKTTDNEVVKDTVKVDGSNLEGIYKTKDLTTEVRGEFGRVIKGSDDSISNDKLKASISNENQSPVKLVKGDSTYHKIDTRVDDNHLEYSKDVTINDVTEKLTTDNLHKSDGSINYANIKDGSKIWLVEESADGSYGRYTTITKTSDLNDDKVIDLFRNTLEQAKPFNKANVDASGGIQKNDYLMIVERNTFARLSTLEYSALTAAIVRTEIPDENYYNIIPDKKALNDFKDFLIRDGLPKDKVIPEFDRITSGNKTHVDKDSLNRPTKNFKDYTYGAITDSSNSESYDGQFDDATTFKNSVSNLDSKFYRIYDALNGKGDYEGKAIPLVGENTYVFDDENTTLTVDSLWDDIQNKPSNMTSEIRTELENIVTYLNGIKEKRASIIYDDAKPDNVLFDKIVVEYMNTRKTEYDGRKTYGALWDQDDTVSHVQVNYSGDKSKVYGEYTKDGKVHRVQISNSGYSLLGRYSYGLANVKYNDIFMVNRAYKKVDSSAHVTNVYAKEQTESTEKRGSATVKYVDEEGNTLKEDVTGPNGVVSTRVVKFYLDKDGQRQVVSDDTTPTNATYDVSTEQYKPTSLEKDGKIYGYVRTNGAETGKLVEGNTVIIYVYKVKKAPLTVNYYLENTTTSLAPSENQADLPVKSDYTTKAKEIPSKTEVQDLPEKTVTTVTTYELVATPDNATGKISEGGTTVNYYYRAVPKKTEVAKKAPVVVNYYKEGTTEKLADSIDQGQKDIGSNYTTDAKTIQPKVEKQDLADRVVTTTTIYELVAEPTDKEGVVPVGGKVVNYYYREVVKKDEKMKDFKKVVIWHNETNYDVKHVFDRELEKDFEGFDDNSIFLNQKYGTKTSVKRHVYDARIGFSKEGDVYPSEDKIRQEEEKYAKMLGYSSREELNKFNKNSNTHLDLVKSPTVFENHFEHHTIQSPLTSGHFNMTSYLADFRTRGGLGLNGDLDVIEGKDSDESNLYESKLPDGIKLELTKVTYNIDGGEEKTLDKSGAVFSRANGTMQEGKTTHFTYYYRVVKDEKITNTENLKGSVVVKYVNTDGVEIKNSVTIKDNVDAGQRLTKTITSGTAELGSKTDTVEGTTKYDANMVKENRIEKDGKTYVLVRVLPKDDKLKNTEQVEGVVKPGTTTIIYEYREVEKGNVVANYYLENTTTKLADSETQTPTYYGTDYKTVAKTIQPKVDVKDTPEKTVTTTTTYELVEKPANAEGKVSAEQTVVNYYYRAITKEDVVLKQAPVTVNYYKEGTTEKLADSVDKGQKQIGSKYMTDAASIEPKVEKVVENGHVITRTTTYELVKVPEDKDGIVPTGGKVVNYYYREVVKEVAKPNDAPKVDVPDFNGGVPPLDPPVVNIPEYNEQIGIPGEPEVHEKPEFKGGVTPIEPPVVEIPEFNGGVPGIPEVHEKPEFKGGVPGVPEIYEKPEFKGGVVPNDAPIHEKPEANIPDVKPIAPMSEKPKSPEKPAPKEPVFVPIVETPVVETPVVQPKVETPQAPQEFVRESVLPNTAGGNNLAINVLGALTLTSVLGLAAVKRKEEE